MNELKIFKNPKFGQIRTIEEDGNVLFCGSDVAKALGYTNVPDALKRHCRYIVKRDTPHPQSPDKTIEMSFIPEGDIYRLAARSELDGAAEFESWIFDEVLPSIRKHGAYMTGETIQRALTDPDFLIELATTLKAEKTARLKAEQERDLLLHTAKSYTSTEIAKELGLPSAKALNKHLAERGIQYKQNGTWVLYSKYSCMGYTEIKQTVLDNGHIVYDRKWTDAGRDFLLSLINRVS